RRPASKRPGNESDGCSFAGGALSRTRVGGIRARRRFGRLRRGGVGRPFAPRRPGGRGGRNRGAPGGPSRAGARQGRGRGREGSADVCSSDLGGQPANGQATKATGAHSPAGLLRARGSEGSALGAGSGAFGGGGSIVRSPGAAWEAGVGEIGVPGLLIRVSAI